MRFTFFEFLDHGAKFSQRIILNLPRPLPRDAPFSSDFLQRFHSAAVQSVASAQDVRFAIGEIRNQIFQHAGYSLGLQFFKRVIRIFITNNFGERAIVRVSNRRIQ